MSRIPDDFIDNLLAKIDLVALIGERVALKKAGKEYQAQCPFHDEKNASFTVSPAKQFYHCFGCAKHGNAIRWLMDSQRLTFREAVEILARRAGLTVPASSPVERGRSAGTGTGKGDDNTAQLLAACNRASQYFREQLTAEVDAQDYLTQRGITADTAARFGIGYAATGWDGLRTALASFPRDALVRAGLLSQAENGHSYDKFRGRIMFPIHDRRGRIIGFGGRAIAADTSPKYLNTPETPIFQKGRHLYGLSHVAVEHPTGAPELVVVEGYMDVVALAQHGITNVVATLGTAITDDHVTAIFKATDDALFCFDGDAAGRRAAWKALETVLPAMEDGRQASFLFLPDGEDPDSLVRAEGAEAFRARLADALPLSEYLFAELAKAVNMDRIEGRAKFAKRAAPLLEKIPAGVYRNLMLARLCELTGAPAQPASNPADVELVQRTPIRQAIALLLHAPSLATKLTVSPAFRCVTKPGAALLADILEFAALTPDATTADVLAYFDGRDEADALRRLAAAELPVDDAEQLADLRNALGRIDKAARRRRIDLLKQQELLSPAEVAELRDLLVFDRDPKRRLPAMPPQASGTRH